MPRSRHTLVFLIGLVVIWGSTALILAFPNTHFLIWLTPLVFGLILTLFALAQIRRVNKVTAKRYLTMGYIATLIWGALLYLSGFRWDFSMFEVLLLLLITFLLVRREKPQEDR